MKKYIDIGINLTNRQFQNDKETIIQNALDSEVFQTILTGTGVRSSQEAVKIVTEYSNV